MIGLSPPYIITDLGVMSGFVSSRAVGVNDRGQVIGSLSREDWDLSPVGFLWTDGKMRDLGNVWLTSINNQGHIVGAKPPEVLRCSATIYNSGRFHALLKNTSAMSRATCINDCGQVVGYLQSVNRKMPIKPERRCFVWESGKRRYLDTLVGYQSGDAVAINNHGQIVGELWENGPNQNYAVMNARHAVLWDGTSVTIFDEPTGFTESSAVAINDQGQILVRAYQSAFQGLLEDLTQHEKEGHWSDEERMQELLDLYQKRIDALPKEAPAFHQQSFLWENGEMQAIEGLATALNDQGQVVGWSGCDLSAKAIAKGVETPYAFLWQDGDLLDLNDLLPSESGWRLTRANGINNHGQIVGNGVHNGKRDAFLLTPGGK